jgi:hypothetical protein
MTTVSVAVPPGPVQLNVYVTLAFNCDVVLPLCAVPLHPAGETSQDVASVEVQLIVTRLL